MHLRPLSDPVDPNVCLEVNYDFATEKEKDAEEQYGGSAIIAASQRVDAGWTAGEIGRQVGLSVEQARLVAQMSESLLILFAKSRKLCPPLCRPLPDWQ
jgi:hypothetical protein